MIFYVACIPTLEAIVCVAAFMIFMRGRCSPLYTTLTYTLPRSHQQEAPTQFLSLRAVARNERNMPLATEEQEQQGPQKTRQVAHAAIGSAQLVYRHYVYKIGKHCLNYIHLHSFLHR